MNDSDKTPKKRPTLVEGFNNIPNILEEARQAVDQVTQTAKEPGSEAKPARPRKPKAATAQKVAKESAKPKKAKPAPSPSASLPEEQIAAVASPSEPATVWSPPVTATLKEPPRDLAYYGISVKHAIPGRIRLYLKKLLYNETLAEKLPALLAAVPGVNSVEASTATGSLLITFNSRELASAQNRRQLDEIMNQFFPGLETERLVKRLLGS